MSWTIDEPQGLKRPDWNENFDSYPHSNWSLIVFGSVVSWRLYTVGKSSSFSLSTT